MYCVSGGFGSIYVTCPTPSCHNVWALPLWMRLNQMKHRRWWVWSKTRRVRKMISLWQWNRSVACISNKSDWHLQRPKKYFADRFCDFVRSASIYHLWRMKITIELHGPRARAAIPFCVADYMYFMWCVCASVLCMLSAQDPHHDRGKRYLSRKHSLIFTRFKMGWFIKVYLTKDSNNSSKFALFRSK